MNVYGSSAEETVRTRRFLKEWAGEGFLTAAQYERLERESVSEVRTTNPYLAVALFFFTLVIVVAVTGLFFSVFHLRSDQETSFLFIIVAASCYGAAERAAGYNSRSQRIGLLASGGRKSQL